MITLVTTKLTISLASSSISISDKHKLIHKVRPSLKAQSSAVALSVIPIFLANPFTQEPKELRIRPPLPVRPGYFKADPSVFNLNQQELGRSHLIGIGIKRLGVLEIPTISTYINYNQCPIQGLSIMP